MKIGYARRSTPATIDGHFSIPFQARELIRAGCLAIFDEVVPGTATHRPQLEAAISLLTPGDHLMVWRIDRLARSTEALDDILARIHARGACVRGVNDDTDSSTPEGLGKIRDLAFAAQIECEAISHRTVAALKAKRARGEVYGPLPIGYRRAADGVTLEPHPEEQVAIERVLELRAEGVSYRKIAQLLGDEGHPARGARWHKTTLVEIVRRAKGEG